MHASDENPTDEWKALVYAEKQPRHSFDSKVRISVNRRDRHKCQMCGARNDLEIHHIKPRADGGLDDLDNLILLCRSCHDIAELEQLPSAYKIRNWMAERSRFLTEDDATKTPRLATPNKTQEKAARTRYKPLQTPKPPIRDSASNKVFRDEISKMYGEAKSWRAVSKLMGMSPAYAMRVARGDFELSEGAADAWIRNYRNQHAGTVRVRVCATCGGVHVVGDCHGKDGTPVIVADGEKIRLPHHTCHPSTVASVEDAHVKYGSWRKTAKGLGYQENFATVLSQIAAGKEGAISPEREDELRERLGMYPMYGIRVAPCRTCGQAHSIDDCNGKDGDIVIVGEDEVVKRKPRPKQSWPSYARRERLRAACKDRGITVEDAAEAWLEQEKTK